MPHYYIRWSRKEFLDWEAHPSRAEADARAKQLVGSGETYTIEECDDCSHRCGEAFPFRLEPVDTNAT